MTESNNDKYDLNRFIEAQSSVFDSALLEIKNGSKCNHWMWFIFPQIDGLGFSSTTKHYAIKTLGEAREYLNHSILGVRYIECLTAILSTENRTIMEIFGFPDYMKLKSSLTLFEVVAVDDSEVLMLIEDVFQKFFNGKRDENTLGIIGDTS